MHENGTHPAYTNLYENIQHIFHTHSFVILECIQHNNVYTMLIIIRDEKQSSLFIILQVHSTYFGCQPHPPPGVHKTVTKASGTGQLPHSNVAKLELPRFSTIQSYAPDVAPH